ncbi:uncharacterized protein LOC135194891 [Macrobrachium nipponense]|uniref:uncharacterized protein LOC135194891 n=1 Tax=Macrobrachium nipponense TaxID=159736 RepID=UPI0030C80F92
MKLAITAALSAAFVALLLGEVQGYIFDQILWMSDDCWVECTGNSTFCADDGQTYEDCSKDYLFRCYYNGTRKIYDRPCPTDWNETYVTERDTIQEPIAYESWLDY